MLKRVITAILLLNIISIANANLYAQATSNHAPAKSTYDSDHDPDLPPNESFANAIISLSSDAHYAISSNLHHQVVLWDLEKHTHQIISNHANTYSAYFIKHSPYFMWQSLPKNKIEFYTIQSPPSKEQLDPVAKNQHIIISHENDHYYAYFYNPDMQNHIQKKEMPHTLLTHYLYAHPLDVPLNVAVVNKYRRVEEQSTRMHLIEVLIKLGYHSGNIVHVQDTQGHEILSFDNFPVYGHVMTSDLKTYFASSMNWSMYKGYGNNQQMVMMDNGGFYSGKLFNLTLSTDEKLLLSSGAFGNDSPLVTGENFLDGNINNGLGPISMLEGLTLWSTATGHPLRKYQGLGNKMIATLSPNAKHIVGVDEGGDSFVWNIENTYRGEFWGVYLGKYIDVKYPLKGSAFLTTGLIRPPKDFINFTFHSRGMSRLTSAKYIDDNHVLIFYHSVPYAVLYDPKTLKPVKYLYLGNDPLPSVNTYYLDEAIETVPSKHILVIGMVGRRGGILVYHYDPKTQTLKKIWTGHFPPVDPEKEALRKQTLSYKIAKFFRDLH